MAFSPKDGMTNLDRLSTVRGYWIGTWGNEVQIINSSGAFVGPGTFGDVVGPASSTDNAVARYDLTTGKLIQNSGVIIDDSNNVTGVVGLTATGNVLAGDGIASAVGIGFAGDPDTGFIRNGSGDFLAIANSATIVRFNATSVDFSESIGFTANNSYDLGSSANRLKDIYVAGTSNLAITLISENATLSKGAAIGGGAISTSAILSVTPTAAQNPLSGVTQRGIRTSVVGTSAATTSIVGVSSAVGTDASAFTTALRAQFETGNTTKGAGSTITRDVGYYGALPTQGTNNAFISDNNTFTGNWFLNSSDTNASAFSGAMDWAQIATPSNPASGRNRLYFKSDGNLYCLNSSGTEMSLGDVVGPASATDNAIARFNLTTGRLIQNSVVTISDLGAYASTSSISVSGAVTGGSFIPTDSTLPAQGMYFSASGTLAFSNGTTFRGGCASTGLWSIGNSATTGTHTINGGFTATQHAAIVGSPETNVMFSARGVTKATGVSTWGIGSTFTSTTTQTASANGFYAQITIPNSAYTTTVVANYVIDGMVKGAAATVTRYIGLRQIQITTDATNNAAIADNSAFTGNYFINSTQTNPSLFSGIVDCSAGVRTKYSTANTANPPTDAELDSAFGTPATVGSGFLGVLNDNAGGTNEYLCWSDGTNWFYAAGTLAV